MTFETTKADGIALVLEEAIVSGELKPGSVLRQGQLSRQFSVSRTPVREALRKLAALGLAEFVPNRGVRVRSLATDSLREAFEVRARLEELAAELAATRIDGDGFEQLERADLRFGELTAALRELHPDDADRTRLTAEWVTANHAFHDVILGAAGSSLLEQMAKSVRRVFLGQAVWAAGPEVDHLYELNVRQHRAIREAMLARSPGAAGLLAREHVLASGRLLGVVLRQISGARDDAPLDDDRSAGGR